MREVAGEQAVPSAEGEAPHAVVIGSGMGGLSSARLLQMRGYRVTVLEQHTRPGGMLHRFFRDGVPYDTGFHYCGSIAAGAPLGQALRHLGVFDSLTFTPLDPDGFDVLEFPGRTVRVPVGWDAYEQRLAAEFPEQARGIATVVNELQRACDAYALYRLRTDTDLAAVMRNENVSVWDRMSEHITDPQCLAVLCGQSVLYGVPPRQAPFGMHALVMDHFLTGAWSIEGGGDALAMSLVRRIRADGGTVRLRARASRIEVTDRTATAVVLDSGETLTADVVVANMHPRQLLQLIPDSATRRAYKTRVREQRTGIAHLGVYLQVDGRVPELGRSNYYRHAVWDPSEGYASLRPGTVPMYFASAPTEHRANPDPDRGVVLMVVPMDAELVAPFRGTATRDRPPAYEALKAALVDTAVEALLADHPTLRGRIRRVEGSTPLTTEHYTLSPDGAVYGHFHSIDQMGRYRPSQRTRVNNLVMVGQGVGTPGILGVTLSAYYGVGALTGDLDGLVADLRQA